MLVRVMRCKGRTPDIAAEAVFSEAGGTIGRSSQCTLALPDADRHISRIQAEVSWSGTAFVLTDRGSGNPTLRNGEAVGMGQSVPLTDGDELHIGDYVLRVELPLRRTAPGNGEQAGSDSELASTSRNLELAPDLHPRAPSAGSFPPAHRHDGPAADPPSAGIHPGEHSHVEGDISFRSWESSDGVSNTAINPGRHREVPHCTVPAPPLRSTAERRDAESRPSPATHPSPLTPAPAPEVRTASISSLLAALLAGAGMREAPHDPFSGKHFELDEHNMERLGKLLRLLSQGVIDLLATRTMLKSEMHAAVTVIGAQGNNPLKFSPDADTALAFLLAAEPPRGFMTPELAVEDAMSDLLAHQMGMLSGMRAALDSVLLRFEPQRLEARLAPKSLLGGVLPMNRKAKLWEQFEALYDAVSGEAQNDFEALFSEAFARAYEERTAALKYRPGASGATEAGNPGNTVNSVNSGHATQSGER